LIPSWSNFSRCFLISSLAISSLVICNVSCGMKLWLLSYSKTLNTNLSVQQPASLSISDDVQNLYRYYLYYK
jgi:hypothetical protein